MKKVNIKSILLLSMLFLQTVTLKAQDDLTRIYGVYAGTATTEIETAGGSMKQPGERKFQVEIVKRANDTKLILKNYKLGNYEFEEIVFDNFGQYYQPEKKGWNFFTDPLSGKYLKTKDNIYSYGGIPLMTTALSTKTGPWISLLKSTQTLKGK